MALNALISEAAKEAGTSNVVLGMPHRGRLSTLIVLNDFPMRNLLHKVAGNNEMPAELVDRIDDIPTHIAVSNTKKYSTCTGSAKEGRKVTLSTIHNPSHLESQTAIGMGKVRAKMDDLGASDGKRVLNI